MNSSLDYARISALAYLYDNLRDFPTWFRKPIRDQLRDIASVMGRCHSTMEDIERREVLRVIVFLPRCEEGKPRPSISEKPSFTES